MSLQHSVCTGYCFKSLCILINQIPFKLCEVGAVLSLPHATRKKQVRKLATEPGVTGQGPRLSLTPPRCLLLPEMVKSGHLAQDAQYFLKWEPMICIEGCTFLVNCRNLVSLVSATE